MKVAVKDKGGFALGLLNFAAIAIPPVVSVLSIINFSVGVLMMAISIEFKKGD